MKRRILLIALVLFFTCSNHSVWAQEFLDADGAHRGVVQVSKNYKVFPENRLGNSIYFKDEWLSSKKNYIMVDAISAFEGHVYHAKDKDGKDQLGYLGDEKNEFTRLFSGYYLLKSKPYRRKIYRIAPDGKVQDLLPRSKTATGLLSNGAGKAIFYHISKNLKETDESGEETLFHLFKLHLVDEKVQEIKTLEKVIKDSRWRLKLKWKNPDTLLLRKADGTEEEIPLI